MPLQFKNIAVGNLQDDVSGNNYAANKAVYILNLNNTLAQIFSDEAGTVPIVQDGVNNVTGAKGVFGFWVEAGDYFVQVGANKYRVSITGADYFNNRIDETVNLIVDSVAGRGAYYVVGSFEVGFTYTDINQVGTFGGTDYYVYTGGLTNLPHIVPSGTDPTLSSDYAQVFYGEIDNVHGLRGELNDRALSLTLAEAQLINLNVGQYVVLKDRANALCEVQPAGVVTDGFGYIGVNNGTVLKVVSNDGTHNLDWYGAKGDDSAFDNRSAILALLGYLDGAGGEIRVPAKTYYTTAINPNLTNITAIKIIGASERYSQLRMMTGGTGYVLTADSQRNLKLGIENLTIHGNRTNAAGSGGLKLAYQYLEGYKRVTCRDVGSLHCWNLQGCNNNTFDNCTAIYADTGYGFNFQLGTDGQKSIGNTFSSCDVEDVGKRGIYVGDAGRRNTWLSPWIEWRNDSGVDSTNIAIYDDELLNSYLTPTIVNSAPNNKIKHMILLGEGAASTTITGMPNNAGQCVGASLEIQGTDNKHFIRGYGSDSSSFNPNDTLDFNNLNNDTSVTIMVGNTIYGGFNVEADTLSLKVSRDDTVAGTVVTFGNKNVDGLEVFTSDGNLEWGLNVLNSRSLLLRTNQQNRIRIGSTGEIQFYNLPSTPSTTQFSMWYDPANGNSVKYVP